MRKSLIRRLLKKNYYFAKFYYELAFRSSAVRDDKMLIVYQMGKVGSSSVVETLKALNLVTRVYHVHVLTPEGINRNKRIYYGDNLNLLGSSYLTRSHHLLASEYLCKRLKQGPKGKKWKVITLTRDPVGRNVSSFFQTLDLWIPDFLEKYEANALTTEQMINIFLEKFTRHDAPLTWFDVELNTVFDTDIFATNFEKSKGYQIYEVGENVDLLILKLEMLNKCAKQAFQEFLGINDLELLRTNTAANKVYSDSYKSFLNSLELPTSYLDKMYDSKYTRHFYSDEEVNRFRAKWAQPAPAAAAE